MDIKYQKWFAD